jgi:hypothetical protein
MEITKPVCGSLEEHPPHHDMPFDRHCRGCSPEHADVAAMAQRLLAFASAYRYFQETIPAGTKLLMHPLALNLMTQFLLPSYSEWNPAEWPPPSPVPEVPVVVDQDLPRGSWRLVVGGCEGVIRHGN